ncbi:hypothetical protein EAE96_000329 [Botrytis aclada]|nr:hypothetical protein EAE96_000329 [Botrytis aclada]
MAHQESSVVNETYDYIVCGGGTSGCVIAARLADNSTVSILLVEAGASNDTYPATTIPAAVSQILGTEADWNIKSEPCEELENRRLHLARGKFLSGSSGCNGTLAICGNRQDYDNWGLEGWSGDEMFQYMSKMRTYQSFIAETFRNKSWFKAEKDAHGYNGPLITSPHDPAPISKLVLESYQSMGLPLIPDMFSTGNSAHGCGHAVRTVSQGTCTMSTDYITSSTRNSGILIRTNTYIDRISLETDITGAPRANGVFLQDITGKKSFVKAREEVIISAGTYGSPAILLRSGIGARQEVEKLGIQSQVDLPGVGKNLMDHLETSSFLTRRALHLFKLGRSLILQSLQASSHQRPSYLAPRRKRKITSTVPNRQNRICLSIPIWNLCICTSRHQTRRFSPLELRCPRQRTRSHGSLIYTTARRILEHRMLQSKIHVPGYPPRWQVCVCNGH